MKACEINIGKAIDETIKLSQQKYDPFEQDTFSTYSPIYLAPTSNVKDATLKVVNGGKSALTVGSQGGYIFELLLNGYKKIDCFDKNVLQYLYYEYVKTFIEHYSYELFIRNFTASDFNLTMNRAMLLNRFFIDDILFCMPDQAYIYWDELYSAISVESAIYSRWCRTQYIINEEYLKKFTSYYNEKEYKKLQSILKSNDIEINYHICDFEDVHKEFEGNIYDTIIFDNILQYYTALSQYNDAYNAHRQIKNNFLPMLNENGKMMVCYGFEVPAEAVKMIKGDLSSKNISLEKKFILEQDIKKGFIATMIKKYDDYTIEFIKGVEEECGHDNVLLLLNK